MSGCCSDNSTKEKDKEEKKATEEELPKSYIGRFLHRVGERDIKKNKAKNNGIDKKKEGGCC